MKYLMICCRTVNKHGRIPNFVEEGKSVDPAGVLSMAEMQSGYISNVSKTTATKGS
jgi:hypothetical protein